ncbi:MAG TPA: hypothetical protein VGR11_16330 [Solirubrobacteraceae bacterium]|nr:hypothetical protein [Solirubrobacteraceae bacterium]
MSNPPPDGPTEPLRPAQRTTVAEERVSGHDPILLRLEDTLNSLRTGLMIVGVIAVAALGVAVYSLMSQDDDGGGSRSGLASDSRVSELDDRVDRISRQVQDLRSGDGGDDDAELGNRVEALEGTVKELAERPVPDATQAVKELSDRIDDIASDVEELKSAQSP